MGPPFSVRLSPRVEEIKMEIGSQVPTFCLPDEADKQDCLSDFRGKWVVLYFYPKDNTAGCTREAVDFSEQLPDFEMHNAAIIGISPDSPAIVRNLLKSINFVYCFLVTNSTEWRKNMTSGN